MAILDPIEGLIDEMNMGPLACTRMGARGQDVYGTATAGAETTFDIDPVAVHTVSGADLQAMPEAYRTSEVIRLYARTASWPAGQSEGWRVADGGDNNDRMAWDGKTYRVINSESYKVQARVWMGLAVLESGPVVP